MKALAAWFDKFLFPSRYAYPLAALRSGLSFVLLLQGVMIWGEIGDLWGPAGLLLPKLNRYIVGRSVPFQVDLSALAAHLHLGSVTLLQTMFVVYLLALLSLLLGFQTRVAAFLTLTMHLLLKFNQGYTSGYGVDTFAHAFLFYCLVFPVGDVWSLDQGRQPARSRIRYGFALRVMQIHLSIAYFSSGIAKSLGPQWRNGEVIWRALTLPQFHHLNVSWMASVPWVAMLMAWGTLFLETGYPVLMSSKRTRTYAAFAIISLHIGIILGLGLWIFGLEMIVLTSSFFLVPSERQITFPRTAADNRRFRAAALLPTLR